MAGLSAVRTEARRWLLRGLAGFLRPSAERSGRVPPRRILLIRPDHLGDVLLASPAVAWLAAAFPEAEITYLVGPWSLEVARAGSEGLSVRSLLFPGFTRRGKRNPLGPYLLLWREAQRLRAEGYDAAVVLRPDHWWGALLALAAGIPRRFGVRTPETAPLLTDALEPASDQPAARQSLWLAHAVASTLDVPMPPVIDERPRFTVSPADEAAVGRLVEDLGLGARAVVAIHPSAGAPLKRWPVGRWADLADRLADGGCDVVLTGGPGDEGLLEEVRARMRSAPKGLVSGRPLGVMAAFFGHCALVTGPDSGALHLAAAVGTPTVRLYGPAAPALYGPWPPAFDQRVLLTDHLPCVPCGHLESPPCGAATEPPCFLAHAVADVEAACLAASRASTDS